MTYDLDEYINEILDELKKVKAENEYLKSEAEQMINKYQFITNEEFKEFEELKERNKTLELELKELNQENEDLDNMNEKLKDEIMELEYKLEDLEE